MTWTMYRWVWQLRSPLHIGVGQAGPLARTRLYIPASTLWGALTAELTRRCHTPALSYHYQQVGEEIKHKTRFSYLFPAEKIDGRWKAWLPEFSPDGLNWKREDNGASHSLRKFRNRLLSTLPGTAIDPSTDTAQESTFGETEVVHPFWQDSQGPVAFIGYLFVNDQNLVDQIFEITELFLGADTRYGLGRLEQIERQDIQSVANFFGQPVNLNSASPKVQTKIIFAHIMIDEISSKEMKGSWEIFERWDQGIRTEGLCWVPGSIISSERWFKFLPSGIWCFLREE